MGNAAFPTTVANFAFFTGKVRFILQDQKTNLTLHLHMHEIKSKNKQKKQQHGIEETKNISGSGGKQLIHLELPVSTFFPFTF